MKYSQIGKIVVLIVCVDDIVLTENEEEEISKLKRTLALELDTKELEKLKYFFSVEVT